MTDLIKLIEATPLTYGTFYFIDSSLILVLVILLCDLIFSLKPAGGKIRYIIIGLLTAGESVVTSLAAFGIIPEVVGNSDILDIVEVL